MSIELPLKPKKVGTALIASLDHLFPDCNAETARQGIAPFSCCDPKREKMCDKAGTCPFALGFIYRRLPREGTQLFVGYGVDFVVVWFMALPAFSHVKRSVDVQEFFQSLLNEPKTQGSAP